MSELREHQYELAEVDAEDGLVFGTEDTGYLTTTRPQHQSGERITGDAARAGEDGITFTRDYIGAKVVGFEIGVLTDVANRGLTDAPHSAAEAYQRNLDYLDALEGWWTDPLWRERPDSMAMLRACEGGRVSRAYGRPRRYDEVTGSLTRQGYSTVTCDFAMIDGTWYDEEEQSESISFVPSTDGGVVAPLVAPLRTTRDTTRRTYINVGGSKPTWLLVTFNGPFRTVTLDVGQALRVQITQDGLNPPMAVRDDKSITIDPRPWRRTVLQGNTSVAGRLGIETVLKKMLVPPGRHLLTLRGTDPTGRGTCTVRWRNARNRP